MADGIGTAEQGRRRFRPGLWLTLCALLGILVLLGLGTWQLQRLGWKEGLIAERAARLEAPEIALPADLARPADLEYRRVRLAGTFLHERELHQGGRTRNRRVGFHVVTPLRLDDGRTILVDRGWVPPEAKAPETRPGSRPEGPVEIAAILRTGGWKGRAVLQPDNDPAGNHWIWLDLPAMTAGLERPVTALYAVALPGLGASDPEALPKPAEVAVAIRNDHLEYALTWYALAVALAVIYVLVGRRPERRPERPGELS